MIEKITTFKIINNGITFLNSLEELEKTAAEFELPEGHIYDKDFLYLKVRAVSAGEYWGMNKNSDFFPEEELKQFYKTFLDAHVFKNHENKKSENAIGGVISSTWNDKMKYVELIIRIDRQLAPSIVRSFEKGTMTDVSMGCKIKHSICSICGNKAETKKEYCDHVKYERGKLYPDGRRVFEINIGPKFHDISAVLNGADKTAKAVELYEKTESLGKAASADTEYDLVSNGFKPYYETEEFRKIASEVKYDDFELFPERKISKKAKLQKIAEIKKIITGKVTAVANEKYNQEYLKEEDVDNTNKITELFYTDYWGDKETSDISNKLKDISEEKEIDKAGLFKRFLDILSIAGINISPLEFSEILNKLTDSYPKARSLSRSISDIVPAENIYNLLEKNEDIVKGLGENTSLDNAITLSIKISDKHKDIKVPELKNIGEVLKELSNKFDVKTEGLNESVDNDLMSIIEPFLGERSNHRSFALPRMIKIIKINKKPNFDNLDQFSLPIILKTASTNNIKESADMLAYSAYQNNKLDFICNEDYIKNIYKFANTLNYDNSFNAQVRETSGIEKNAAYDNFSAWTLGLPAVYGYSAAQRSRIENGDNVSAFNRYIATNPSNAYILQALFGPKAWKKAKSGANLVSGKVSDTVNLLKKTAIENDNSYLMEKEAEILGDFEVNHSIDIFNDPTIDAEMRRSYNDEEIKTIKAAAFLLESDDDLNAQLLLDKLNLSKDDINRYLNICENYLKIDISKQANAMGEILFDAGQDVLFNPKGASPLTSLPGNLLDGFIFYKLGQKLTGDSKQNNKINSENELAQ